MTKKNLTGRQAHQLIESTRENGNLLLSLESAMHALVVYSNENDQLGFAEALDSIFLTIKQLYHQTKFQPYWILAGAIVESSVEIARQSGNKDALALPQFNLAQYLEDSGKIAEAKKMYQKAITSMEKFPPKEHNRPAVLTQMKLQLALYKLNSGNSEELANIEELLAKLSSDNGIDAKYNCKVWISGGYLKLALHFKNKNRDLAQKYLQQAREIIEADKHLVIRRQQLDELSNGFKNLD